MSDMVLKSGDREVKKAVVMRESGGDRSKHLLEVSTEML